MTMPMGGGIDGPLYADYQDVTDKQQLAGAAMSVREKLNLLPDSLVLDINKFSGDLKLYFAKADTPVLPPTIKMRSSGPIETTSKNFEEMEKEFMHLIEMLPPKLRILLLKNMMLPKDQRNPELNGLEKSLQDHVKTRLWARSIVARFRQGERDEEEEEERRGIYSTEEEEDLLPEGTVIPETKYVPISRVDPTEQSAAEMIGQIQANTVFMLETHLGILKLHLASLEPDDPARGLLRDFPKVISRMIGQSKMFVNLRNLLDYEKAKKVATGIAKIDLSIVQEQRNLLEKARRYGEGGPSASVVSFATAMLGIAVIGCQILRGKCTLSALCTEGSALMHSFLLTSSPVAGEALTNLMERLGNGFEVIGIPQGTVRILQMVLLTIPPAVMLLAIQQPLPVLASFSPETTEDIYQALAVSGKDSEADGEKEFKEMAREAAVRLASAISVMEKVAYRTAKGMLKATAATERSTYHLEATCIQLVTLLSALLSGSRLFEKSGEAGASLFATLTTETLKTQTSQFQALIDSGAMKPTVAEALNRLRLADLAYEGQTLTDLLSAREEAINAFGIRLKDLRQAGDELVQLASFFALANTILTKERSQVAPSMNLIA